MTHSKKQLRDDLRSLGVSPGDTLLMHSSYKSLGGTEEGAAGFYEVLLDLLGERGTLIIPTLSYRDVTREAPDFDVRATPSCVGYLTEFFRTGIPDARRSLHATHSCCVRGSAFAFPEAAGGGGKDPVPGLLSGSQHLHARR